MIHESFGFAYWRKQKQFLKSSPFLSNILIWEHPPVSSAVNDSCLTPRPVDLGSQQGCSTTSTKWKPHKVDQWRIPTALGNIFVPGWEANSVTLSHRFHLQQKKKKQSRARVAIHMPVLQPWEALASGGQQTIHNCSSFPQLLPLCAERQDRTRLQIQFEFYQSVFL